MKIKLLTPVILTPIALFFLQAAGSERKLEIFSVCELNAHGPELTGQHVRLRARFITDLNHFSLFFDRKCSHGIVAEDEPVASDKDPSVRAFDKALWYHAPFENLVFDVDVSGKFEWEKTWEPPLILSAVLKPQPRGVLTVEKFWSFKRVPGVWKHAKSK